MNPMVKLLNSSELRIETLNAFRSIVLVVNPLVWYSVIIIFLQNILTQQLSNGILTSTEATFIWCLHFSGIVFAALIGSSLTKKFEINRFLIVWMALGTISSISLFAVGTTSILVLGFIVLLLGVSLGLGMPACMEYYTDSLPIENRGRIGGVIMLISGIGVFLGTAFLPSSALVLCAILAIWRLTSLLVFYPLRSMEMFHHSEKQTPSYRHVLSQQSFVLYFIPWAMFSLVNYLSGSAQLEILGANTVADISLIQSVMTALFAVIGGFLLDFVGRKRIAISGFIFLGVDSATLGLFPDKAWANYFGGALNGVAWGFLLSIFIVTIWGDLSQNMRSAKYYAIGVSPFFISKLLGITVGATMSSLILKVAGQNGFFSFLAFFLCVAVLPLVYAPETLPEKTMKDRDLKSYAEKALKQSAKQADKKKSKDADNSEVEGKENEEEGHQQSGYDEALELAEKYY